MANALGFSFSTDPKSSAFRHPFKASLGVGDIGFSRGVVDDVFEPVIKKVPISEGARLKLDVKVATDRGESWCCLEVTPNAEGILDGKSRVEIVHTDKPRSLDPAVGRIALALILWTQKQPIKAFQIVYFNLRYHRVIPAPGGGPVRHLFL